ncbi:hypothetical protein Nstercoris_01148 [Nitrosomonas stercoris]|uniref:RING-type E3 ubiquitin transferase n=1 Tax=Nitrosomonas stercoris TaxID=1444684 RepID=A0A4Y1YQ18_9PROT|nr:hypothetical protein Nstercoris_01148 [Nitrosomonas stercoris]
MLEFLSPEEYGFVLFSVLLVVLMSFYYFVRALRRWRLIQNIPTARLRSVPQGQVELEGQGRFSQDRPIFAPLSNHQCVWYHSLIEGRETVMGRKRTRTEWKILYQRTSDQPFLLDDGTGTCLINPVGADIISNEKLIWYGNTEWPSHTQILDSGSAIVGMSKHYRYSEQLILPGQKLYVLGHLQTRSAATDRSARTIMIDLLADWKQNWQQLLKRFDANQDGEIDQAEWEKARIAAWQEAQETYQKLQTEPAVHHVFCPKDKHRPFIISVRPQAELIKKYRYQTFILLTLSSGLMSCMLWLIHTHG